jgi:hypothetical protein
VLRDGVTREQMAAALGWSLDPESPPDPSAGPQRAWSWTALEGTEICPRRYYVTKVSKLVSEPPSEEVMRGRSVHEQLAAAVQGDAAPPEEFAWTASLIGQLRKMPYVKAEKPLTLTDDFRPVGKWANDVRLRTTFDAIAISGSKAVILDWKTGKRKGGSKQLDVMAAALLLSDQERIEEVHASFVWLKDKAVDSITMRQPDAVRFITELRRDRLPALKVYDGRPKWQDVPAIKSWACRFCVFYECEFHNGG